MQWKKDASLKYTDLCIYVDENIEKLRHPGEYPEVENRIYNYLWLLIKALAIKRCMFSSFDDYDGFAFHGANRVFFALRKNLTNQGKIIKGKYIRPIKSCLNYTKSIMNAMKIEYQNETFRTIIDEEHVSKKFDSFAYTEQLRANAAASQGVNEEFRWAIMSSFDQIGTFIDKILKKSPFRVGSQEYTRLKISIMLNSIALLKNKKKLDATPTTIILWKLPKSMSSYVRVLLKEFFMELKLEIMDCYQTVMPDEATLDCIVRSAGEQLDYEETY